MAGSGTAGVTISNLAAGDYTVRATDNTGTSLGCTGVNTVTLGNVPRVITAVVGLTAQSDCSPVNGAASITTITVDGGTPFAAPGSGYTYDWDDDAAFLSVNQTGTTSSYSTLSAGIYYLRIIIFRNLDKSNTL